MINTITEKRQDYKTRQLFDYTIINLKDILSCYDSIYHYQVITAYFKAHNLFSDNEAIKGRIIYKLIGVL